MIVVLQSSMDYTLWCDSINQYYSQKIKNSFTYENEVQNIDIENSKSDDNLSTMKYEINYFEVFNPSNSRSY